MHSISTQNRNIFSYLTVSPRECDIRKLGCRDHYEKFTAQLLSFFVVTRMHFYTRDANRKLEMTEKVATSPAFVIANYRYFLSLLKICCGKK